MEKKNTIQGQAASDPAGPGDIGGFKMDLGIIAHEIKSPIAATIQILHTVEFLLPGEENAKVRRMVKRAIKRASSALDLTRNLLEYMKLDHTDRNQARSGVMKLSERIPQLLEKHLPMAEKHNVRVICEFGSEGGSVNLSEFEFDLILDNLVSNAIRYSKRDDSLKRVWLRTRETPEWVILTVEDEGIGMKEEDRVQIFSEFFRSNFAKEQTISGSGLGMAIVKKIADEINAHISCASIPGKGTTFTVKFPRVQ